MHETGRGHKIFLLSPASLQGIRARQLTASDASFATALRYQSAEGVPIGEAYTFLSSLYFRGKIAYAQRFAAPPPMPAGALDLGTLVIAPGFGFVLPHWPVTRERMETLKRTPVDLKHRAYTAPMREQAQALREHLPADTRVVLLGSIATGKYVDLLEPVFGERLVFPAAFVGQGDMRRGSLMLNAARDGVELEYSTLDVPRHGKRERR
jgi:hypothetical protein